ncbi:kinesin-like protein KIF26B [Exaiptasia diaphana]|uniref:Kinesin-like protein KIF26A/B helical domain-containing protein n=1 Tax=Exaiptasia diaphana TaxID=2652724 RepID=A0A913YA76_EXADI|nr:kinesin-like protein KIF26B [Exaiptasia diaphana]
MHRHPMAEMRPSASDQVSWSPNVQAGVWCEKCNNRLVELKRQVLRMILPEIQSFFHSGTTPNTGSLSSRIFNQIRLPESHLKSWHADQCQVCSTHLNQLKWEAVSMVHTLEESQFLAYYNIPGYVVGPKADQVLRRLEKQKKKPITGEQVVERGLV